MFGIGEAGSDTLEECYSLLKGVDFDPKMVLHCVKSIGRRRLDNNFAGLFVLSLVAVAFTSSFEPVREEPKDFFERVSDQRIPSLKDADLSEQEKQLAREYLEILETIDNYQFQGRALSIEFHGVVLDLMGLFHVK